LKWKSKVFAAIKDGSTKEYGDGDLLDIDYNHNQMDTLLPTARSWDFSKTDSAAMNTFFQYIDGVSGGDYRM
jgi:hypothetical protein